MVEIKGRRIGAVGLDLGHTLMAYDGVPMSWQRQYPAALEAAAGKLGFRAGGAWLQDACDRLAKYNTRLYPRDYEYDAQSIFADVLGSLADMSGDAAEEAIDAFFGYFRQTYRVYGDALPFLGRLKAAGIPAGVLTDVPYGMPARWVARDTEPFTPYLDVVLSSVAVGFRKPNAAGFIALAQALGVDPKEMVYIGDEEKDITGAKAVGMMAVLIDRRGNLPAVGEDIRICSLDELPIRYFPQAPHR